MGKGGKGKAGEQTSHLHFFPFVLFLREGGCVVVRGEKGEEREGLFSRSSVEYSAEKYND